MSNPPSLPTIEQIETLVVNKFKKISGSDSDGNEFKSMKTLYDHMFNIKSNKKRKSRADKAKEVETASQEEIKNQEWYNKAFQYWEDEVNCPITDDGVLGGYGALTPMDSRDSNRFMDMLLDKIPGLQFNRVADCGAGIGRVTKHLLLPRCGHVDLVEQSPRLLNAAEAYIKPSDPTKLSYLQVGLQDFNPEPNSYDCIWIQWVIGHLNDLDFITFFQNCARGLTPKGVIVLKDNVICSYARTYSIDLSDSSVSRHMEYLKILFELSNVSVVSEVAQVDFPDEIYPVYMFALRPK